MKTSNKIISISLCAVLIIIAALIITSRLLVTRFSEYNGSAYSDEMETRTLDLRNFTAIETGGVWRIDIEHGEDYFIEIQYPESAAGDVEAEVRDACLHFENYASQHNHRAPFRARITMPHLERLETRDGASILLRDVDCDKLAIRITGAAEIDADNCRIEYLQLRCEGAANANFRDAEVVNANLNVNGASRIVLTMGGGELTGNAAGAASIVYYGEVQLQDIATAGAVSVRRR